MNIANHFSTKDLLNLLVLFTFVPYCMEHFLDKIPTFDAAIVQKHHLLYVRHSTVYTAGYRKEGAENTVHTVSYIYSYIFWVKRGAKRLKCRNTVTLKIGKAAFSIAYVINIRKQFVV